MSIPAQTSGVGVAAQVTVDASTLTLSLGGTATHQIVAQVKDAAGTVTPGPTALVLTAVANASGSTSVYTGTITGGGSNALAGKTFVVAGFATGANNGTFIATASSTTTLTLDNAAGAAETHAGTATEEGASAFVFKSRNATYATVSSTGLITGVASGNAIVEVSYPVFDNTLGNTNNDGTPAEKIYAEITVNVTA
jgi:hypothetical protein